MQKVSVATEWQPPSQLDSAMRYDLLVLGNTLAAQRGAIAAATLHKRVAIVVADNSADALDEARPALLQEAYRALEGDRLLQLRCDAVDFESLTMADIRREVDARLQAERLGFLEKCERLEIDVIVGTPSCLGGQGVAVQTGTGTRVLTAERILVATGTRPARPERIPFDGRQVLTADELLGLDELPKSVTVVGAGSTGIEFSFVLATMGVRVTLVDGARRVLPGYDAEIVEALLAGARSQGIGCRLGRDVVGVDRTAQGVTAYLSNGERLESDAVLYAVERLGQTDDLNLDAAGVGVDDRGRLWCDQQLRTWAPGVYAAGEVVGFPGHATDSTEAAEHAVYHAFGQPSDGLESYPMRLETSPAVAGVGRLEGQLRRAFVSYTTEVFSVRDLIEDAGTGPSLIKILSHRETHQLLGVQCLGDDANAIVRVARSVLSFEGTADWFRDAVAHELAGTERQPTPAPLRVFQPA